MPVLIHPRLSPLLILLGAAVQLPTVDAFSVRHATSCTGSAVKMSVVDTNVVVTPSSTTWSSVESIPVRTLEGQTLPLGELEACQATATTTTTLVLSCLSHFGDFNAWELTQQYLAAVDDGRLKDGPVVLVGIGSVTAAQQFAEDLELADYADVVTLVADEDGAVSDALGCYRGWLAVDRQHRARWPGTDVNPYLKLFGMIFGLGSPGTMSQVLVGYTGQSAGGVDGRRWVVRSLLQGARRGRLPRLDKEAFAGVDAAVAALRPFELATLRAQTGLHIVRQWKTLGPANGDLFTRMGGTFVFDQPRKDCTWEYYDAGILCYADMAAICAQASM